MKTLLLILFPLFLNAQYFTEYYYDEDQGTIYSETVVNNTTLEYTSYGFVKESYDMITNNHNYLGTLNPKYFETTYIINHVPTPKKIKYFEVLYEEKIIGYYVNLNDNIYIYLNPKQFNI